MQRAPTVSYLVLQPRGRLISLGMIICMLAGLKCIFVFDYENDIIRIPHVHTLYVIRHTHA